MRNIKFICLLLFPAYLSGVSKTSAKNSSCQTLKDAGIKKDTTLKPLDTARYDSLMLKLANGDKTGKWPVKKAPRPLPGAILPFYRIVAYYGNMYSKNMGVLGEYPPKKMLVKLKDQVKVWEEADPTTPVKPALHYICVTAQAYAGANGFHSLRMPFKQIDSALHMARSVNGLLFLDVQIGSSTVEREIPLLEKYLKMPDVNLGIDPEFSMKDGSVPGKKIGSYDAADVNYVTEYLASLVKKYHLPPKIFILHRFTQHMVTNYQNIKLHPEIQFVMDMDGWGGPDLKKGSYHYFIEKEPVQFTGFKLFYKVDITAAPHRLLTTKEILQLKPIPIYIQYQ